MPNEPVQVNADWKQRADRVNATRILRGEKRVPLGKIAVSPGIMAWVEAEEKRLGIAPKREDGQTDA